MFIQHNFVVLIILFLVISVFIFIGISASLNLRINVTLIISILALLISLLSIFKNELFPLKLKLLTGDVIFLKNKTNPVIDLVLSITFINTSYADGVIEFVALKVTNSKGKKKIYLACNELDNRLVFQMIRQPQTNSASSISAPYSAFPIQPRQSIKKYLGFAWSSRSDFTQWEVETYKFELYLKSSHWKRFKKFSEFEHEMTEGDFNSFIRQDSYYMAGSLESSIMRQVNKL